MVGERMVEGGDGDSRFWWVFNGDVSRGERVVNKKGQQPLKKPRNTITRSELIKPLISVVCVQSRELLGLR